MPHVAKGFRQYIVAFRQVEPDLSCIVYNHSKQNSPTSSFRTTAMFQLHR